MTPVYRNFIFDADRGFIFAYVPKVACTNWKAVLRHLAGHADYLDPRLAHDRARGGLRYLDLTGEDRLLLTDPGIRRYAFVRSPHTRILSAYLNKIAQNLDLLEPLASASGTTAPAVLANRVNSHWLGVTREIESFRRSALDQTLYPAIDFEVFLLWLRDSKSNQRLDEHWQTQTILLRWPEVKFDFLGRFENLSADSTTLLGLMGTDIEFPTQKQVKFLATGATTLVPRYFTDAAYQLCEQLFRPDFASFGYPVFPVPQPLTGG